MLSLLSFLGSGKKKPCVAMCRTEGEDFPVNALRDSSVALVPDRMVTGIPVLPISFLIDSTAFECQGRIENLHTLSRSAGKGNRVFSI